MSLAAIETDAAPAAVHARRWRMPSRRWLGVAIALVLAGVAGNEIYYVIGGSNLHPIVEGRIYRCAQLSPSRLRQVVEKYGIRTVINLRGCCPWEPWHQRESETLDKLGVRQIDVSLSSYKLPPVPAVRQLIEAFDTCEYPLLIHCRRGSDRTGLMSGCTVLLNGGSLADARRQLSWRFGHVAFGPSHELGRFFDLYEDWLRETGRENSPDTFREWATVHYLPLHCWAEIAALELPTRIPVNQVTAVRVRCLNRSRHDWHFYTAANRGVCLAFKLLSEDDLLSENGPPSKDDEFKDVGGAGYFDKVVRPGESIDLHLALPPVARPGRYLLRIDMADADRDTCFSAFGSKRLEVELEVFDGQNLP